MQRKWRRFDGRIWSRVEFLQCQRSRRIFTVGITVFLRFPYRITQSNGRYLLDWLICFIDWLICRYGVLRCISSVSATSYAIFTNLCKLFNILYSKLLARFFQSCLGWVFNNVIFCCFLVSSFIFNFSEAAKPVACLKKTLPHVETFTILHLNLNSLVSWYSFF